jgi:putative MFS transporter
VVLAWIAGSSNLVTPKATIDAVTPAFTFFAVVGLLLAITFYFGVETRKKSIEELNKMFSIPQRSNASE